jgi:hypothetical protein
MRNDFGPIGHVGLSSEWEIFAFGTRLPINSGCRKQMRDQGARKLDWGSATIQTGKKQRIANAQKSFLRLRARKTAAATRYNLFRKTLAAG